MIDQPDLILLTIDALRADHLSCHGYNRETPTFDALAEKWLHAPTTASVSPHTREAMPPLLSGHYPERFYETGFMQLAESETLAGKLRAAGYTTGGFQSNPYLSRAYNFDVGFDDFYDDLVLGQHKFIALAQQAIDKFVLNRGKYYARAPEINDRSLDWLAAQDGPVFLWNHYMDPHGPYHAPNRYYEDREQSASDAEALYRRSCKRPESITDQERHHLIDAYDDEIRYLDNQLDRFLHALRDRDRFEDALVVITSDHGDAFGRHGYFGHPRYLHESLLRVPLFLKPPGGITGAIETPVSTLDVVPTLLSFAEVRHDELPGKPLVTRDRTIPDREGVVFASAVGEGDNAHRRRFAARDTQWKVMLECDIEDGSMLDRCAFDLDTDSDEQQPMDPNSAEKASKLIEQLVNYSDRRLNYTNEPQPNHETTKEIDDRLEALGYK